MYMRQLRLLLFFAGVIAISAFLILGVQRHRASNAAKATLETHFTDLRRGKIESVLSRYSSEFFRKPKVDRERWQQSLSKLIGTNDYTIIGWEAHRCEPRRDGICVWISCQSRYPSNGFTEDFEFFRARGTTNFVILSHVFD